MSPALYGFAFHVTNLAARVEMFPEEKRRLSEPEKRRLLLWKSEQDSFAKSEFPKPLTLSAAIQSETSKKHMRFIEKWQFQFDTSMLTTVHGSEKPLS